MLCIQADCCLDRDGIFPYLEANGIGLEHGLFYEAYAMLLESSREYAQADHVFQVGISRYEHFFDNRLCSVLSFLFLYLSFCRPKSD